MSSDAIKVGMIGCGGNARGHMSRLLQVKGVEIVGLCDPAEAAIQASYDSFPQLAKTPAFTDYRELLAAVQADAVEISTPHTQHFEHIMASLDSGRHVLCEKPMVCQVDHAHQVIEKVAQTGLIMGVSYQRHNQAPYRYCRELIRSGQAGRVQFISALQSQNWYNGRMAKKDWRGKLALSGGGQLNDSGSHLLDILLWMTDLQPAQVFALQDNLEAEVDILTAMSVQFSNGAMCNISVVGDAVNFMEDITIWCQKMTLAIRGDEVWTWTGETREIIAPDKLGSGSDPDTGFITALRGGERPQATPEDALKVIQLSEAAWRSAAEGQPAAVLV